MCFQDDSSKHDLHDLMVSSAISHVLCKLMWQLRVFYGKMILSFFVRYLPWNLLPPQQLRSALTAAANWINTTAPGFDQSVATAVHKLYELAGGFFNPFFVFVSYLGKGGIFLIVLSLALLLYRPTRRFGTAMCIGLAIGAIAANVIIKPMVARPRPYMDEASIFSPVLDAGGPDRGARRQQPSGHRIQSERPTEKPQFCHNFPLHSPSYDDNITLHATTSCGQQTARTSPERPALRRYRIW